MSVADWSRGVITMDFNVNMPSAGLGYRINGSGTISGSTFGGSFVGGQGLSGTNSSSCFSGCSAGVNGFFAGTDAARAGVAYHINDSWVGANIIGAAAFAKQ
jgi:hypothetical protein